MRVVVFILAMAVIWIITGLTIVFADDTESDLGLCLRGWTARCPEAKLQHDLQGKLWIWNSLNCSVRDICTPTCEPDDETYNITGRCDPDDMDDGSEP